MIIQKKVLPLQPVSAEIAQLVEHDLAKVGVAGSSPVFRSINKKFFPLSGWWNGRHEGLKILWLHGCAGSSPASGTICKFLLQLTSFSGSEFFFWSVFVYVTL